jgi:hypothetical protein
VLLANIGANVTVVSAGLLHDTIDDSFVDYDHIFHMFMYHRVGGRISCNYLISIMMLYSQFFKSMIM